VGCSGPGIYPRIRRLHGDCRALAFTVSDWQTFLGHVKGFEASD
jgi:hypothetical protein